MSSIDLVILITEPVSCSTSNSQRRIVQRSYPRACHVVSFWSFVFWVENLHQIVDLLEIAQWNRYEGCLDNALQKLVIVFRRVAGDVLHGVLGQ